MTAAPLAFLAPPPEVVRHSREIRIAALILGPLAWAVWFVALGYGNPVDARAYWLADYGLVPWGQDGSYVYSPAFTQATEPLRALGWEGFLVGWRLIEWAALAVMAGPWMILALPLVPVTTEISVGNIHLLLALAVVAGFRWPAAWAFVLLTKVTPGVGLLWFVVRREWRSLGIALGVTAAIVAVSFAFAPGLWADWIGILTGPRAEIDGRQVIPLPLVLRLVAAAGITIWAALTDRRWGVLVAAFVALPSTWFTALAMLAGVIGLRRS